MPSFFLCPVCWKSFDTQFSLMRHFERSHEDHNINQLRQEQAKQPLVTVRESVQQLKQQPNSLIGTVCRKWFSRDISLQKHLESCHKERDRRQKDEQEEIQQQGEEEEAHVDKKECLEGEEEEERNVEERNTFLCVVCRESFSRKFTLKRHFEKFHKQGEEQEQLQDKEEQRFVCVVCGNRFTRKYGLQRHFDKFHREQKEQHQQIEDLNRQRLKKLEEDLQEKDEKQPQQRKIICMLCGEVFSRTYNLRKHCKKFHKYQFEQEHKRRQGLINQRLQQMRERVQEDLRQHEQQQPTQEQQHSTQEQQPTQGQQQPTQEQQEGAFVCKLCGQSFVRKFNRERHMERYHQGFRPREQQPQQDQQVEEIEIEDEQEEEHKKQQQEQPIGKFECKVCRQRFVRKFNMERHMERYHEQRVEEIEEEQQQEEEQQELVAKEHQVEEENHQQEHVKGHHQEDGEQPEKQKANQQQLHEEAQDAENPQDTFVLMVCGENFSQKFTLKRHIESPRKGHDPQQQYNRCEHCNELTLRKHWHHVCASTHSK